MSFYDHMDKWQGVPVCDWTQDWEPPLTGDIIYRLDVNFDDDFPLTDKFAEFLSQPGVSEVTGLVIGLWSEDTADLDIVVEAIAGAREKLPALTKLFIGDISAEESEISWIQQSDLSPLFTAYPLLEHFKARGGQGLSLGIPRLPHLKSLTIETGGLPVAVIREVCAAELPALEHLELYLGASGYGSDSTLADLLPILEDGAAKWPKLTYLGLRNCEYTDEIAAALTANGGAPLLHHLQTLDLSLGTLGDEGVLALAGSPAIARLAKLDIHHHFASEESIARLTALGVPVDASDVQKPRRVDSRYVAVSE